MNSTRADGRRFWLSRRFTGAPVGANGHNAVGHRGAFRHPLHAALSLKMNFPEGTIRTGGGGFAQLHRGISAAFEKRYR